MINTTSHFLTGAKIYLRPISQKDLTPTYRDWFNDEEICRFNSHHRFPKYDEDMRAYYEEVVKSQKNLVLAICDKNTDIHIGNVTLENIDNLNQSAEFAIIIGDKSFHGKGVGKEAMTLIVRHGFQELNLHRIYFGTSEDNLGMKKLGLSLGFKKEGRLRDEIYKGGKFKDIIRYGLLKKEFEKQK